MSNFAKVEVDYTFGELFNTTITPARWTVIDRNMKKMRELYRTYLRYRGL
jgi:hypothetical protein